MLDDLLRAALRSVRVEPGLAEGSPLPEKVPALVERDLQLLEPLPLGVGRVSGRLAFPQFVFLGDELFDRPVNLRIWGTVAAMLRALRTLAITNAACAPS